MPLGAVRVQCESCRTCKERMAGNQVMAARRVGGGQQQWVAGTAGLLAVAKLFCVIDGKEAAGVHA